MWPQKYNLLGKSCNRDNISGTYFALILHVSKLLRTYIYRLHDQQFHDFANMKLYNQIIRVTLFQMLETFKLKKCKYQKSVIRQILSLLSCVILTSGSSILSYWNMVFIMLIPKIIGWYLTASKNFNLMKLCRNCKDCIAFHEHSVFAWCSQMAWKKQLLDA